MTLSADKAAKLKKIETELMGMQQEQFDYYFFVADSNSSGMGANGEPLDIHRRLARLGLTHDLFESQEDYYDWRNQMQTNYQESPPINTTGLTSSSTAAPNERVMRTGQGIFKDEKGGGKSNEKKEDEESPQMGPKQ
ncbi:TPA: hypothetical protein RGI28_001959 [Legionella pneumophila]|nr:hypothetical protein [Legionella pneumophila]HDU7929985.1 hypothetical protein [Legionella pneumophila]HDU7934728.1 hypothetical protein [Legionella pneumophila]HDU7961693.1 hypothetical protein [Legionella pneumophila]HEG4428575.1 hypothetical protein [Legionella pneumophila]